jgi:NAD(P)H-dependent FMN reductase
VSYGGHASGARAVEHLRLVMAEVMVATVRGQVLLSLFTDFENFKNFKPGPGREAELHKMLDQLVAWGGALRTMRLQAGLEAVGTGR